MHKQCVPGAFSDFSSSWEQGYIGDHSCCVAIRPAGSATIATWVWTKLKLWDSKQVPAA